MTLTTYVNFGGHCTDAFRYYEVHLGGTITMLRRHGESPRPGGAPPEWKDLVLHARITIANMDLQGADIPNAQPMRSAYLSLGVTSDHEAERIFAALSDGGTVFMPLQETFFASRFGQVQDQFGINWMILHERPGGGAYDA